MVICNSSLVALIFTCVLHLAFCNWQEDCQQKMHMEGNTSYSLSSVSTRVVSVRGQWPGSWSSSSGPSESADVELQLCGTDGGGCAGDAAICIRNIDTGDHIISNAGRITNETELVVIKKGRLKLKLAPGQVCDHSGNKSTHFNTEVILLCQPATAEPADPSGDTDIQVTMGRCSLTLLWFTPDACGSPVLEGCPLQSHASLRHLAGLRPLLTTHFNFSAAGIEYVVQLCGDGSSFTMRSGHVCSGPVCVQKEGDPTAQQFGVAGEGPSISTDPSGLLELTYGQDGQNQAKVHLKCKADSIGGNIVPVEHIPGDATGSQLVILFLQSAKFCQPNIDCQVTGMDGQVRDLSAITRTGHTTDRTGSRPGALFYLSLCRPLSRQADRTPCPGVGNSAACMRVGDGDNARGFSLGQAVNPPQLQADGSITIVYTNGSQCRSDSGRTYSTEVQLVCGRAGRQPVFQSVIAGCRYSFVWELKAVCGDQESWGEDCRLRDPLYGYQLDVSSLRRKSGDYAIRLSADRTLFINVCGVLNRVCGNATDQAACLVQGDSEIAYGGATSRLEHANGVLSQTLLGGAACWVETGQASRRRSRLAFTCHQTASAADGPGLVLLTDCVAYLAWPTQAACPPRHTADCRTADGRHDLSGLTTVTGNHMYSQANATFVLNVCRSVNPEEGVSCPVDAGVCLVRPGLPVKDRYLSLGAVSTGPTVEQGKVLIRYTTDQPCPHNGDRKLGSVVRFTCRPTAVGTQPLLVATDGCLYEFEWDTSHACPLKEAHGGGHDCSVVNPQTNHRFDLLSLSRPEGYNTTGPAGDMFHISVCTPLHQSSCAAGTGVCKTSGTSQWNAGMANDLLTFDDGVISLNYSGGGACATGGYITTIITFLCGSAASQPEPVVISDEGCLVTVHWYTRLVCESQMACSAESPELGEYDLTPLALPSGGYRVPDPAGGGDSAFLVNVCQPVGRWEELPPGQACPAGSSACRRSGDVVTSLGHAHLAPRIQSSGLLSLDYQHGSPCPENSSQLLSSEIQFHCSTAVNAKSLPDPPTYASCHYTFEWRTSAACRVTSSKEEAAARCRVSRPDESILDLNTLLASQAAKVTWQGQEVRLRLCQPTLPCHGAVCVNQSSYGDVANLTVTQLTDNSLALHYGGGSPCTKDGAPARRGSRILLTCDPARGRGSPSVTELSECHLSLEWASGAVCSTTVNHTPTGMLLWLLLLPLVCVLVFVVVRCLGRRRQWFQHNTGATLRRLLTPRGRGGIVLYSSVRLEDPDEDASAPLIDDGAGPCRPDPQQVDTRGAVRRLLGLGVADRHASDADTAASLLDIDVDEAFGGPQPRASPPATLRRRCAEPPLVDLECDEPLPADMADMADVPLDGVSDESDDELILQV